MVSCSSLFVAYFCFSQCKGTTERPHLQWFRFISELTTSPTLPSQEVIQTPTTHGSRPLNSLWLLQVAWTRQLVRFPVSTRESIRMCMSYLHGSLSHPRVAEHGPKNSVRVSLAVLSNILSRVGQTRRVGEQEYSFQTRSWTSLAYVMRGINYLYLVQRQVIRYFTRLCWCVSMNFSFLFSFYFA